jgi:hypothetical protein
MVVFRVFCLGYVSDRANFTITKIEAILMHPTCIYILRYLTRDNFTHLAHFMACIWPCLDPSVNAKVSHLFIFLTFHNSDATIYVGGLDEKVSETLLWELFLQAGPVGKFEKSWSVVETRGGGGRSPPPQFYSFKIIF